MTVQPSVSAILESALFGSREIVKRATVKVEWERNNGRTKYRLSGIRAECVQATIDDLMRETEQAGGYAVFDLPKRRGDLFVAEGIVSPWQEPVQDNQPKRRDRLDVFREFMTELERGAKG